MMFLYRWLWTSNILQVLENSFSIYTSKFLKEQLHTLIFWKLENEGHIQPIQCHQPIGGISQESTRHLNLCLCPSGGTRGSPTMEPRTTSFFIRALQGSVTSQVRSTPGPSPQRPIWVISLGKGSECNSSTESHQLSSGWIFHRTWASAAGFSQIRASLLNLIYVNITYCLHKTLQQQASGY